MKLRQVIFFFLIVASVNVFAQKRSLTEIADEAFENKQYVTAVDLYKEAYTKIKGKKFSFYIQKIRIIDLKVFPCY